MNVIGGGTKLIFCEGAPQSLDNRLLSSLLRDLPPTTLIVPLGGKQGLRSFIRGRLAGYSIPPPYIAFRDRDFDVEPPHDVTLIIPQPDRPIYLTYRAAIENYLLDAAMIDKYWSTHKENAPKWSHGNSPGANEIRSWMNEAARQISCYQAVRWALSKLKPSHRWPELNTTWTKGSGDLPTSLAESDCLTQAKNLVSDYGTAAGSVSEEKFLDGYQHFSAMFSSPEFLDHAEYLVWFHGKDLKKSMQKQRGNSISLVHFLEWAVEHADWSQHADLRQLADLVLPTQ